MELGQTDLNSFQVELSFNARNLKDSDVFSKSDPFLKVYLQTSFYGKLDLIGQTQYQKDTLNPNWNKKLNVQYFFEQKQPLRVEVYDYDDTTQSDFIGKAETSLGNIMGATHQTLILDLQDNHGKKTGKAIIRADKIENSSMAINMTWRGSKIKNVDSYFDFWDKSDPYLKFMRMRGDNTFVEVARTQTIMDSLDPAWKPIAVPISRLVSSDNKFGTFRVECWDWQKEDHKHQMIGYAYMKLQDIKNSKGPMQMQMQNPNIKKPGKLLLQNASFEVIPNFIDYLKSGLELNMIAAIDFTGKDLFIEGSNGSPTSSSSLHYVNNLPTQYQKVLSSIWGIISSYDADKKIPAFGFGAKINFPNLRTNGVCHSFPLNDNPKNPQIDGLNNLMNCYINALKNMELSGPTYFAPIIREALNHARRLQGKFAYSVLLILTDGQIHDMNETKNLIVQNSNLPISIVIVGIGNADFNNMRQLDGDGGLYSSNGKKAPRDIVQFVPFNNFQGNADLLTKQLLKQIPGQVVQYFKTIGVPPKPIQPPKV